MRRGNFIPPQPSFRIRSRGRLDHGYGSCLLKDTAAVVAGALRYFDGTRYELLSWCVMPNHVHVLTHLERGADLARVLHSWKSYTAHQIGRGEIWQAEYFDRIVGDERELRRTMTYIRENPVKAGLVGWEWVG